MKGKIGLTQLWQKLGISSSQRISEIKAARGKINKQISKQNSFAFANNLPLIEIFNESRKSTCGMRPT